MPSIRRILLAGTAFLASAAVLHAGETAARAANESGLKAMQEGRYEQAAADFERACAAAPQAEVPRRNLAAALALEAESDLSAGHPAPAVPLLDRALELRPHRLCYRLRRGQARLALGTDLDRALALEDFRRVLDGDPDEVDALSGAAEVYYLERQLKRAVRLLRHAVALSPDDAVLRERLKRAEREQAVENHFQELSRDVFQVRYGPQLTEEEAQGVLDACMQAYRDVGARLGSYPNAVTAVTVYTPAQFHQATHADAWVGGLSDGTIRITMPPPAGRQQTLLHLLRHELTHQIIRQIAAATPRWLHEGLAQDFEGASVEAAERRLAAGPEPHAVELFSSGGPPADAAGAQRFYDLALSFVAYLGEIKGDSGLQDLLRAIGDRGTASRALESVYGVSPAALFSRWREARDLR